MKIFESSVALLCALCSVRASMASHSTDRRYRMSYADVNSDGEVMNRQLASCGPGMSWRSSNGQIFLNGNPFHLKGTNWFGFETDTNIVHGLWGQTSMDKMLSFAQEQKFNALRIPISLQLALNPSTTVPYGSCQECNGGASFDMLDRLIDKAAEKGILILLDMHRLNNQRQSELWYDDQYSEQQFIQGWLNLIDRFGGKKNLLGIDLKNEPYGRATWNMNESTDWDKAAVRITQAIKNKFPSFDKLVFVEGVGTGGAISREGTGDPAFSMNWGMNLDGITQKPLDFGSDDLNSRLVYSPHVYGPSVSPQPYFNTGDFPNNLFGIWDKQVGFIEKVSGKAAVVGEWGGTYVGNDKQWQDTWSSFMVSRCMSDNFVWCLNPNSGDTGGLLKDDWTTPDWGKLTLLNKIQPNPSVFTKITDGEVCVEYGAYANPSCASSSSIEFNNDSLNLVEVPSTPTSEPQPGTPPPQPQSGTPPPQSQSETLPPQPQPQPEVPINTNECAEPYKQCGGKNFASKCCPTGYECQFHNIYWSGCDKASSNTSDPNDAQCNTAWSQCGGQNWNGSTCCVSGYTCVEVNQWFSQCKRSARLLDESDDGKVKTQRKADAGHDLVHVPEDPTEASSSNSGASSHSLFESEIPPHANSILSKCPESEINPGGDVFPKHMNSSSFENDFEILPVDPRPIARSPQPTEYPGTIPLHPNSEYGPDPCSQRSSPPPIRETPFPSKEPKEKQCIEAYAPCGGHGSASPKCCEGFICKYAEKGQSQCVPIELGI